MDHDDQHFRLNEAARRRTGPERHRRQWTLAEKRRIVAESLAAGTIASSVARRHGIHPNQLYGWRRSFLRSGQETGFSPDIVTPTDPKASAPAPEFIPVAIMTPPSKASPSAPVLTLSLNGVDIRVTAETDLDVLASVLTLLRSGRCC